MRWAWVLLVLCGCLVEYTVGGAVTGDHGDDDACAVGLELCHGDCVAAGSCDAGCLEGQVLCGQVCVPADACGCAEKCESELEMCTGGVCVCRTGLTRCGSVCVDIRADADHCGGCGGVCEVCEGGECVVDCSAQVCGRSCVEVAFDSLNCGKCGEVCDADEVCTVGECRDYVQRPECTTCPCDCGDDKLVCCEAPFLGGAACVEDGCD